MIPGHAARSTKLVNNRPVAEVREGSESGQPGASPLVSDLRKVVGVVTVRMANLKKIPTLYFEFFMSLTLACSTDILRPYPAPPLVVVRLSLAREKRVASCVWVHHGGSTLFALARLRNLLKNLTAAPGSPPCTSAY